MSENKKINWKKILKISYFVLLLTIMFGSEIGIPIVVNAYDIEGVSKTICLIFAIVGIFTGGAGIIYCLVKEEFSSEDATLIEYLKETNNAYAELNHKLNGHIDKCYEKQLEILDHTKDVIAGEQNRLKCYNQMSDYYANLSKKYNDLVNDFNKAMEDIEFYKSQQKK